MGGGTILGITGVSFTCNRAQTHTLFQFIGSFLGLRGFMDLKARISSSK